MFGHTVWEPLDFPRESENAEWLRERTRKREYQVMENIYQKTSITFKSEWETRSHMLSYAWHLSLYTHSWKHRATILRTFSQLSKKKKKWLSMCMFSFSVSINRRTHIHTSRCCRRQQQQKKKFFNTNTNENVEHRNCFSVTFKTIYISLSIALASYRLSSWINHSAFSIIFIFVFTYYSKIFVRISLDLSHSHTHIQHKNTWNVWLCHCRQHIIRVKSTTDVNVAELQKKRQESTYTIASKKLF